MACLCASKVDEYYQRADTLGVYWLPREHTGRGRVGLTILPGRRDFGRDLTRDLDVLEFEQTSHVLCLLPDDEMAAYGVPGAVAAYRQRDFAVHQLPILDQGVCTADEMRAALRFVTAALDAGGTVVIHCVGGLGRSGLAAAAYLRGRGLSAEHAIEVVRAARSPRALETRAQEQFVERYPG
jgi:protein-tyrosine phosphatase